MGHDFCWFLPFFCIFVTWLDGWMAIGLSCISIPLLVCKFVQTSVHYFRHLKGNLVHLLVLKVYRCASARHIWDIWTLAECALPWYYMLSHAFFISALFWRTRGVGGGGGAIAHLPGSTTVVMNESPVEEKLKFEILEGCQVVYNYYNYGWAGTERFWSNVYAKPTMSKATVPTYSVYIACNSLWKVS